MFKSNKDLMSTGFIDGWMAEKAKNPGASGSRFI